MTEPMSSDEAARTAWPADLHALANKIETQCRIASGPFDTGINGAFNDGVTRAVQVVRAAAGGGGVTSEKLREQLEREMVREVHDMRMSRRDGDSMSNDPQPPRCKCDHEIRDHWVLRVSDRVTSEGGCVHQPCGCKAWRPAETAR